MKFPAFILGLWPIFLTLCSLWGADAAHPSTTTAVLDTSTQKLDPEHRVRAERVDKGEDDAPISYGYPDPYGPITYGSDTYTESDASADATPSSQPASSLRGTDKSFEFSATGLETGSTTSPSALTTPISSGPTSNPGSVNSTGSTSDTKKSFSTTDRSNSASNISSETFSHEAETSSPSPTISASGGLPPSGFSSVFPTDSVTSSFPLGTISASTTMVEDTSLVSSSTSSTPSQAGSDLEPTPIDSPLSSKTGPASTDSETTITRTTNGTVVFTSTATQRGPQTDSSASLRFTSNQLPFETSSLHVSFTSNPLPFESESSIASSSATTPASSGLESSPSPEPRTSADRDSTTTTNQSLDSSASISTLWPPPSGNSTATVWSSPFTSPSSPATGVFASETISTNSTTVTSILSGSAASGILTPPNWALFTTTVVIDGTTLTTIISLTGAVNGSATPTLGSLSPTFKTDLNPSPTQTTPSTGSQESPSRALSRLTASLESPTSISAQLTSPTTPAGSSSLSTLHTRVSTMGTNIESITSDFTTPGLSITSRTVSTLVNTTTSPIELSATVWPTTGTPITGPLTTSQLQSPTKALSSPSIVPSLVSTVSFNSSSSMVNGTTDTTFTPYPSTLPSVDVPTGSLNRTWILPTPVPSSGSSAQLDTSTLIFTNSSAPAQSPSLDPTVVFTLTPSPISGSSGGAPHSPSSTSQIFTSPRTESQIVTGTPEPSIITLSTISWRTTWSSGSGISDSPSSGETSPATSDATITVSIPGSWSSSLGSPIATSGSFDSRPSSSGATSSPPAFSSPIFITLSSPTGSSAIADTSSSPAFTSPIFITLSSPIGSSPISDTSSSPVFSSPIFITLSSALESSSSSGPVSRTMVNTRTVSETSTITIEGSATSESTPPGTVPGATETELASIRNISSSSTTPGITLTTLTGLLSRSGSSIGGPLSSVSGVWTNSSRIWSEGSSIKTFGFPTGQSTQAQDTASASISNPVSETTFLTIAVPPTNNSPGQSSPPFTESGSLPTNAENVTAEVTFSTPSSTPSPSSWPSWTTKSACNGSVADSIVKSSTFTTTWTITTTSFSTGNGDAPCTHLDSSNVTAAWSNTTCTSTTSSCGGLSQSPGSTTLRTVTTMRGESGSVDPNTFYQPLPTDIVTTPPKVKDELPSNPDYPWGGGSPIHRHQVVDEPKEHASNSIGARSKIKIWLWGRSVKRLKPRWFETPPNDQDGSGE